MSKLIVSKEAFSKRVKDDLTEKDYASSYYERPLNVMLSNVFGCSLE